MVDFSGPVTADGIVRPMCVVSFDLAANGYVEEEFLASGTASSYLVPGERGSDGRWAAEASGSAPFRTRIVVRRPADPGRFSGTLLLEWLNVSSGLEADPDWAYLHEEIFRCGHAYAAVSAQALGIQGGQGLIGVPGPPSPGLRGLDPVRYGDLEHPGDKYSFDVFGQIGKALSGRQPGGTAGPVAQLGGLTPARVLAIGESQSAFYLTTYINAVHPLAPVFDGFLVHSRGASAAPLDGSGLDPSSMPVGIAIRADSATPVLVLEAEGDLLPPLAFGLARQDDSDSFRLWEMAGTSHADAYMIGAAAPLLGCDWRINEGPHRYVAQAALHALDEWVRVGTAPPMVGRIGLASTNPLAIARDGQGVAVGGVRTPVVDVPACVLSGEGPPGVTGPGWLVGCTTPLDTAVLLRLYGDKAGYLGSFTRSLDAAIAAGFLLPAHRDDLLAQAQEFTFPTP
jgi:hypothetical protein